MIRHDELINYLIKKRGLKSYLEIGVFQKAHNFDLINCDQKLCVDPAVTADADIRKTSDEFFAMFDKRLTYDLIFIDGLHHAEQVKKDFENALDRLNPNGFIVLHDCNPHSEHITHVPRDNGEWTGDVYRFASTLSKYAGINYVTVDFDYGCAVVWRGIQKVKKVPEITWEYFDENRKELLNLISIEDFLKLQL